MDVNAIKDPSTYEEQLQKIIDRGCIVNDKTEAISILERINYYRFTAYFLPFKNNDDDTYKPGTRFNTVYQIHEFDRELSQLLFSVIVSIELKLRTQIAYYHAHKYGALGYIEGGNFSNWHNHEKFMEHVEKSIKNNESQLFVKHHIEKYGGEFPIWVIIELFSMGELSRFYSDMNKVDMKEISTQYKTTYKNLSSWLLCLTNLRNYCAHYSRLYYNVIVTRPATPIDFPYTLRRRPFDYILMLKFLYCSDEKWKAYFVPRLRALIDEYQEHIHLWHLGFPANWLELLEKPYFD